MCPKYYALLQFIGPDLTCEIRVNCSFFRGALTILIHPDESKSKEKHSKTKKIKRNKNINHKRL